MITIGIDAVDIARFEQWPLFSRKKLRRIFNDTEIDFILQDSNKALQRFASRFAAKEACYKALSPLFKIPVPFLRVAQYVTVQSASSGQPMLTIDWNALKLQDGCYAQISITHTDTTAFAVVIVNY